VNRFPLDMEFKRLLGESLAQSGHPAEALQLYKDMLARDSSNAEAWYESGLIWEQARDTLSAIRCLARAFSIQPVNTYALELAQLYAEARMPQALKLCDQVIRQDSARELVDPFFIKGIYYSNTGQYARSTVFFDSCIARDWKFTDAYIEKGIALFKLKDYARALRSFQMASQVTNTSPDAYYWAGRCYEMNHQNEEAALNYERALALDKDFAQAREALRRVKG
jgi:tetratricopeptide (TPR) repeat protein